MDKKPNFALLIGKKLDDKDKGSKPPMSEMPPDMTDAPEESGNMEDSAVADLLAALKEDNVPKAKAALKDFIDICYPYLANNSEAGPSDEME